MREHVAIRLIKNLYECLTYSTRSRGFNKPNNTRRIEELSGRILRFDFLFQEFNIAKEQHAVQPSTSESGNHKLL